MMSDNMAKTDAFPNVSDVVVDDQKPSSDAPKPSRSEIVKKGHETRRAREEERRRAAEERKALAAEEARRKAEEDAKIPDPGTVPREPGMPDELYDMRHVATRPARTDFSNTQRAYRKLLLDNPTRFIQDRSKLEDVWRAKQEGRQGLVDTEDIGEEKALALLDELLASKGWNMAKCPKCGERFDLTKCES